MNLVQICLALEEQAEAEGFDFDWRSEKAMSSINSIFKTPQTLAEVQSSNEFKIIIMIIVTEEPLA